tara:strand:+ start:6342 stop:7412 length:1071 start_codon:yes stop_codon:yes gene_type:complete
MLDTSDFVEKLISAGYSHLCAVPCSFVKSLINCSINYSDKFEYLPCASEAVACSIAAGLKISGNKPIVVIQSSGLTNMGSCITSLLNPYGINFPIIVSWRTYNDGDSEIQHKHLATDLPRLVNAYGYKHQILDNNNLSTAIDQIKECEDTNKICLLKKDTFSKVFLQKKHKLDLSLYPKRSEFLSILNEEYKNMNSYFIGTTGNTSREMYSFMKDTDNFYMAGNMGGALSLGLGVSLSNKNVIVCGGDAEFVMHMGGLTTAGRYKDNINLTYILFDNQSNKSTGGQNTYQGHVSYRDIARFAGFDIYSAEICNTKQFDLVIKKNKSKKGLRFILVKCNYDPEVQRPPLKSIKKNIL